jgi:anti-sigma factor RsiW
MTDVTPEELAAFADGELAEARRAQVAAAIAADPALAEQVRAHQALKAKLSAHFAPLLEAPLPDELVAPLRSSQPEGVVDLARARERRRPVPRWAWIAGPALAASLVLAVTLDPYGARDGYADAPLSATLDRQLVAAQTADDPVRILLSFRNRTGEYCRAFTSVAESGIACRDTDGWRMQATGSGGPATEGEYQMASSADARLLERAQAMAAGPALDGDAERAAQANGWR